MCHFMTLLASRSPQLAHLVLGGRSLSLEPVYRFRNLQRPELRLYDTDYNLNIITKLGNLANLFDLTIHVDSLGPLPVIEITPPTFLSSSSHDSFRKLRKLHISGVLTSIIRILNDINPSSVVTLVMDETAGNARHVAEIFWKHIFYHLSACHAAGDIEINQHASHQYWYYHEQHSLLASWLSPHATLRNVKSLVINGGVLSGSDDDFRLLACAFPKLKNFVVPPKYYSQGRTLACLFYFSQECPDLREISISLASNACSNLNAIKKLPPQTIPVNHQHPLQKLCIQSRFGRIKKTHMAQTAEFLNLIFPNMAILETHKGSNPVEASSWAKIQRIHLDLQAMRFEQRHPVRMWREWGNLTFRLAKPFPYCPDT